MMTLGLGLVGVQTTISIRADHREQLGTQGLTHLGGVMRAGDAGVIAQLIDELFGGIRADIGHKQRVLDILPVSLGQVILGEDVEQGLAEGVRAIREARFQPGHARGRGFRGLRLGFGGLGSLLALRLRRLGRTGGFGRRSHRLR